jgi:hypothetical protein
MMSKREQLKLEWINAKEKLIQEIITDSLQEVKQEIEEDERLASRVGVELRHGRTEIRRKEYLTKLALKIKHRKPPPPRSCLRSRENSGQSTSECESVDSTRNSISKDR